LKNDFFISKEEETGKEHDREIENVLREVRVLQGGGGINASLLVQRRKVRERSV